MAKKRLTKEVPSVLYTKGSKEIEEQAEKELGVADPGVAHLNTSGKTVAEILADNTSKKSEDLVWDEEGECE